VPCSSTRPAGCEDEERLDAAVARVHRTPRRRAAGRREVMLLAFDDAYDSGRPPPRGPHHLLGADAYAARIARARPDRLSGSLESIRAEGRAGGDGIGAGRRGGAGREVAAEADGIDLADGKARAFYRGAGGVGAAASRAQWARSRPWREPAATTWATRWHFATAGSGVKVVPRIARPSAERGPRTPIPTGAGAARDEPRLFARLMREPRYARCCTVTCGGDAGQSPDDPYPTPPASAWTGALLNGNRLPLPASCRSLGAGLRARGLSTRRAAVLARAAAREPARPSISAQRSLCGRASRFRRGCRDATLLRPWPREA